MSDLVSLVFLPRGNVVNFYKERNIHVSLLSRDLDRFSDNPFCEDAIPALKRALDDFLLWHNSVVGSFITITKERIKFRGILKFLLLTKVSLLFVLHIHRMCSIKAGKEVMGLIFLQSLVTPGIGGKTPIYLECNQKSLQGQFSFAEYLHFVTRKGFFIMDDIKAIRGYSIMSIAGAGFVFCHGLCLLVLTGLAMRGACYDHFRYMIDRVLAIESCLFTLYLVFL